MAQSGYTPIQLYYSTTAAAVPTSGNLASGELAINIVDGKLYYKDNGGVVTLLASAGGASGGVIGPASATDTAVALFDGTTGKLLKNSTVTVTTGGSVTGASFIPSGATVATNGLYLPAANTVALSTNSTEQMRIDSAGNVGIGGSLTSAPTKVLIGGTLPSSSNVSIAYSTESTIPSTTTTVAQMYRSYPSTQAASFNLPVLIHYYASQATIGSSSSITDQYGIVIEDNLTGATNNFGVFSKINAPTSGITTTGTITSISSSGTTVTVNHNAITYTNGQTVTVTATANATALTSGATCTILTVGTTDFTLIGAANNNVGTSFTATGAGTGTGTVTLNVQGSGETVAGAASGSFTYTTTTSQTFAAVTVLTGTVTVSTRYNIYANGTAANYFAGSVGIGAAVPRTDLSLYKASTAPVVTLERGTVSMTTNDVYGGIEFYGNDASTNANGVRARIQAIAINALGATKISLAATGSNSTSLSDRLSVFSTGCTLSGATNITKLNERYNLFGEILQTNVDTQTDVDITADLFLGNTATYTNWMVYMPRIDVVGNYWADYSLTTATARLFKSWAQGIIYTGSAYSILGAVLSHTAYNSDATNFPAGAVNASKVLTVVSATQVLLRFQNRTSPAAASGTDWVWSLEYFNYYG